MAESYLIFKAVNIEIWAYFENNPSMLLSTCPKEVFQCKQKNLSLS